MTATSKDSVLSFLSRLSNQKVKAFERFERERAIERDKVASVAAERDRDREGGRVSSNGYGISATRLLLSLFQLLSLISYFFLISFSNGDSWKLTLSLVRIYFFLSD